MKSKIIFSVLVFAAMASTYGQNSTFELTFSAVDNASYTQLDSIKVLNKSQGGDTVLYYPDTVLVLDYPEGITEVGFDKTGLQLFQNYPNPVEDQTTITLYIPEKGKVNLIITNILGQQVIHTERVLDKGYHSFRFTPGIGTLFFCTGQWKGHTSSIKILHSPSDSHLVGSLEYIGIDNSLPRLKTAEVVQNFSFTIGDKLLYIGYSDILQSGILDFPEASETFTFQFATNIPCPGTPTVTYEGQVYNTVQIFSQCWLKGNLNAGSMINGNQNMQNNGILEKYCYNDVEDSCTKYGGLYQWNEMMRYTTTQGGQGICPPAWHIPTDEEWKVLEGAVDSQFGIGDPIWNNENWRGFDAGLNLKSTIGWNDGGNGTNLSGFSGLPGGYRIDNSTFGLIGYDGIWWTSTEFNSSYAWYLILDYYNPAVFRSYYYGKDYGFSVRCIKDY